jgi:hypothetical protein
MSVYIADTNFFIQAHRGTYPLDVVPSFWIKVKELAETGKIISIDKVKNEIYKNDDELKQWCQDNLPGNFFKDSSELIEKYIEISVWAQIRNNHYLQRAIDEFLEENAADAWLAAFALEDKDNRIIVTQEISEPNRKNRIKIPDVCLFYGIKFVNTIEMFRKLGETF